MPVFISRNHSGFVESVVLAKSKELAQAYWQGIGIETYSVIERDESSLDGHPTGVLPIVKTSKQNVFPFGQSSKELLVIIK